MSDLAAAFCFGVAFGLVLVDFLDARIRPVK